MPSLSVRRVVREVVVMLRLRAAEHGVSIEEEIRRLLARVVVAPVRLGEFALHTFGPAHGVDLELPPREVAL